MFEPQCQKTIDKFYNDQLKRRSIEIKLTKFNRTSKKGNKGVAKAAPEKK